VEIVDAHHHLWNLRAVRYPWLLERGKHRFFGDPTPIQRDYHVADFRADHGGYRIAASVHVQVGAVPEDSVAETRWLDEQAERDGLPSAIVAFADVTSPNLEGTLDAHRAASPRFRGVRQIVSRHAGEDATGGPAALLGDPGFRRGLEALARRGLSFDLQLTPPYLSQAAELFAEVPELAVALCHLGSPWDQSPGGLVAWRAALARFAALPRATCKLSGVSMFDPAWTQASLVRLFEPALALFGSGRVMWGSNFPVDKLSREYSDMLDAALAIVPESAHDAVFGGTARAFYRLR
jgi:predicted TIM-barrel fold metal-dependent hydrolase